jgi:cysteinyl-tRNA synthetase
MLAISWLALECRADPAPARAEPLAATSMAYVLQADSLAKTRAAAVKALAGCDRDLIVIDTHYSADQAWTKDDVAAIRAGKAGRTVVAYLSIGEAENYRAYWKKAWDANHDGKPDAGAPDWLGTANPDWPDNYLVKYWLPAWQQIVMTTLDAVIDAGFDGVYLDRVDAFESYEYDSRSKEWVDHRPNPQTKQTYRQDMIQFVTAIAEHARSTHPTFRVIPQNGSQLLREAKYSVIVDAIGLEDLFTEGNKVQPGEHTQPILEDIAAFREFGKPVFLIEYANVDKLIRVSRDGAKKHQLVLLITDRELKTLGR